MMWCVPTKEHLYHNDINSPKPWRVLETTFLSSFSVLPITQWKFSSQKGMKNNFLAKPRFEPVTAEFPQYDDLTIQPQR